MVYVYRLNKKENMRILCLTDSLGSGGAQRQLVTLAVGLKKRRHSVRFLVYNPLNHFLPMLQEAGIPCQVVRPLSYWRRLIVLRRILRQDWQDVVIAFLEAPCLYAELAKICGQRWGLVTSERSAYPRITSTLGRCLRQFHRFADTVVTNSHTTRLMLEQGLPFLKSKLHTVYNIVDLERFRPSSTITTKINERKPAVLRIVVAASYQENKNMIGVAKALLCLRRDKINPSIMVDWFGAMGPDPEPFKQVKRFVAKNGLVESIRFHNATQAIAEKYASADAVGLFSFYEGLPNVVCEGMACGKPILLSKVCEADNLVRHGENGFLCDPTSSESIADSLIRLALLSKEERRNMGIKSRNMAESLFSENIVIECYERILKAAIEHQPVPANYNWPAEVPESAGRTIQQWSCRAK